jgi:hypothetical protein
MAVITAAERKEVSGVASFRIVREPFNGLVVAELGKDADELPQLVC